MTRTAVTTVLCALVVLGTAAAAQADGLPVLGVDAGPDGVTTPSSESRYVTLPTGNETVVARVRRDGGQVLRSSVLRGDFTIPAVALDATAGGLSADGKTLALIRPRRGFPQRKTSLVLLDAQRLSLRQRLTLPGDFSFDAISPEGRWLFLIHYTSRRDPTHYEVRLYDLRERRLLAAPVVDPRERGEAMRGFPITRAVSPDGRWAYTLYDGAGKRPFIHALDMRRREAACIDLDAITSDYALRLGIGADGGRLDVLKGRRPLAVVDTRTFRVSAPAAAGAQPGGRGDAVLWALAGAVALGLVGALAFVRRLRRRPALTSYRREAPGRKL